MLVRAKPKLPALDIGPEFPTEVWIVWQSAPPVALCSRWLDEGGARFKALKCFSERLRALVEAEVSSRQTGFNGAIPTKVTFEKARELAQSGLTEQMDALLLADSEELLLHWVK
jgi:hypothetical protein